MSSILLVGVGNEFRADDAAGMLTVRAAASRLGELVRAIEATDDLTRVIDHLQDGDRVLFIDAVVSSDPPGTIKTFNLLRRSLPSDVRMVMSHAVSIPQVIDLAKAAGVTLQSAHLVGIAVDCLGYGTEVCEPVRRGIAAAVAEIERLVSQHQEPDTPVSGR